jgi:methionyl-tRNA formyltransferase
MTTEPSFSTSLTTKPDVLLLGDGPTALTALRSLIQCCRVVGVIRTSAEIGPDPVRICAEQAGIPILALQHLHELSQIVRKLRPAAVVISSFNRILSPEVLSLGCFINVHYSPLPRYRGRANVNWAVINGEPTAAISIHIVSPCVDSGNILFQDETSIQPSDTAASLYCRLNTIQERELGRVVARAVEGFVGVPQDHKSATYGCARIPEDGEIDWSHSTIDIDRLIRALTPPFPGAFTHLEGQRLIIARAGIRCNPPSYAGRVPGRIVRRSRPSGWVDVLTGDGLLRIFDVIPESGGISSAAAHITSTRATLGLSRLDLLRRIEVLESRIAALEAARYS